MANNNLKNKYVSGILNLKKQWDDANATGDKEGADYAAKQASAYYDWLRKNGYSKDADKLSGQNYTQAVESAKNGLTPVRDYMNQKGTAYGLSGKDINGLLSYDNDTGQVSFGGKNLGSPIEIGGTSYMAQKDIDGVFNDAMANLGIKMSDEYAYKKKRDETYAQQSDTHDFIKNNMADYKNAHKNLVSMARNDNPLDTEWGRGIMDYYNLNGLKAGNNAAASSAGSNSGNIDSYAAANALRQQKAFTSEGISKVAEQFLSRLGVVQQGLAQMGAQMSNAETNLMNNVQIGMNQAQQGFDNSETAKNNAQARRNSETERQAVISGITGYIPNEVALGDNQYFDPETGGLVNANVDYQAIINKQKEILNNPESSQEEKNNASKTLRDAIQARAYKVLRTPGYEEWADTLESYAPEENASMRTAARDYELQKYLGDLGLEATRATNEAANQQLAMELDAQKYGIDREYDLAQSQLQAEKEIAAQKAKSSGSKSSGGSSSSGGSINISGVSSDGQKRIKSFISKLNKYSIDQIGTDAVINAENGYQMKDGFSEMVANQLRLDTTLTDEEKLAIIDAFGLSAETINQVTSDSHRVPPANFEK